MKKFYNTLFLCIGLVLISVLITSCETEDDDSLNSNEVTLLSYGPSGLHHGDTIRVIGYNLDRVASIEMSNATVAQDQFISQSSDLIEFKIPMSARRGSITLKTGDGEEIVSKTMLNFDVDVEITSITAEARPGTPVSIMGTNLHWVDSIQFGTRPIPIVDFATQSDNELVFSVPLDAKTGTLIVYTGGTDPLALETEDVVQVTLPEVTSISPSSVKHGDNITITGTDLDLVGQVKFTAVEGGEVVIDNFVSQTATEIVVTVPDNTVDGTITLVTAFSLVEVEIPEKSISIILPAITGLSPNPIDDEGQLTVTGTNLDLVKSITFSPGIMISDFSSQSATEIVVKVPAGAARGSLTLTTFHDFIVETDIVITFTSAAEVPVLDYYLYEDTRAEGWDDWSYGGSVNWESTSPVFAGSNALQKSFDGSWGVVRFHASSSIDVSSFTELVFYVYGGEGYNGEEMYVLVNEKWEIGYGFTAVPGEWTEIVIPITDINQGGATESWNDFMIQSGITGTVSFDHIGLR